MNLGQLIDDLHAKRVALQKHLAAEKPLRAAMEAAEREVLSALNEQGVTTSRSTKASVSVTEQEVANVEDWEQFYQYLGKHEAFHLLQRRIASKAVIEELAAEGEAVPGVKILTIHKLGVRSL